MAHICGLFFIPIWNYIILKHVECISIKKVKKSSLKPDDIINLISAIIGLIAMVLGLIIKLLG